MKSVKRMIKKCNKSKEEILQGLMILQNTPLSCGKSPAELIYGRRLRDNLPNIIDIQSSKVKQLDRIERKVAKKHHDETVRNINLPLFDQDN